MMNVNPVTKSIRQAIPLLTVGAMSLAMDVHAAGVAGADMGVETIVITATRSAREINEIAANITSIDAERVDAIAASDIRDLLRYEPGVTVEGSGRYGISDINIRGINGDRVLILLDGIPVADEFSFGPNLSARRDFIDVDLIKQVDVIRGPASTLYGSDAIGGVVAFTSKDPSDLVEPGESFAGRAKVGYISQSSQSFVNLQLAGVNGDWQWLVNTGYRDQAETDTYFDSPLDGAQRQANPQDGSTTNGSVKLIWTPGTEHRLTLVGETFKAELYTDITSDIGTAFIRGVPTTTTASTGDDERSRERISLHYSYAPEDAFFNRFTFDTYSQSSETLQHSEIVRTAPTAFSRTRDSYFSQDTLGVLSQIDFQFEGALEHYLIAGFEWQETDSESLREGLTLDPTGAVVPEFSVFPARDFPVSTLTEFAFYVQDEIQLFDGTLTLSPGIRYDKFDLEANADDIFVNANPGVTVADFDDSELSTKLGMVYQLSPDANIWTQWSEGFRIPPMDDINVGFTNFAGGYTSLANPDLRSERVQSIEVGYRQSFDNLSVSISAYQNDYQDFIESLAVLGFNPMTGLVEFQARNVEDVEIKGVDVSLSYYLDDWQMRLASSWQDSEDKATGEELDSVLPAQTVVGIQYGQIDAPWRVEIVGTYTQDANVITPEDGQPEPFVAPSATLIDLLAHYQISDNLRINAGIFNLTDKQYWYASEVRGRTAAENLDRFTAPGRNYSVNIVYTF
ncbi:TonB-dependent hemoglobin/transferrin/lactoferrin family receptor [Alteromonas sp. ASW11-36]|uniref:TonB-dependent hemoglobin/transferrin/lactoferrin family receptor n=1 Tax=Alteromonas arenosi TaxID=3055817 RepID=A0ABT7SZZ4_9ALTE|nr:TonB-dependent hemoglobin/transferrin/lactoferrin family receptor [Alteromonas sp. ASW11-36]MDM7861137.1 TonB-dependent hemoglobin/transferrin/lactoferrin family receptor [Alteromonas sp. ASW11-36]